jgi:hypothetical protein
MRRGGMNRPLVSVIATAWWQPPRLEPAPLAAA